MNWGIVHSAWRLSTCFALLLVLNDVARGEQFILVPDADNTLYEDPAGGISNGSGEHLFAGRVGLADSGHIRRALIRFPVDEVIPAGSVIESVTLTMEMTRTPAAAQTVALRRVAADGGEGASDAPLREGNGAAAAVNDATWRHRFFSGVFWSTMGGQY
ncbi:MAG: hypothetical protein HOP29_16835, partial [Phycisphaerales bacterium]|nr:hypothetical protein [Phycisphaerales bacterium]